MLIYSINLTKHSHTLAHADGKSFGTQKDCNSCVKKRELGSQQGRNRSACVWKANIFWQVEVRCHIYARGLESGFGSGSGDCGAPKMPNARLNCYLTCTHTHSQSVKLSKKKKNDTPSGDGEIFDIRARIQLTIIGWQLTRPMWRLWECGGHRKNPLTVLFSCQPAKWVNNLCNQSGLSLFWHNYLPWHFQCISVFASELVWLLYVLCIRNTILFKTQSCCLNIIQFSWVAI